MLILSIIILVFIAFGYFMSDGRHDPEYNALKERERQEMED